MSGNDEPISPHIADSQSRENPAPSPGAFFSHARRFVIAGGNFNNITNITHPIPESDPTDFEEIPIGQLDLLHQRHCRFTEMPESLSMTVGSIIWGPHSENPVTIGYVPEDNFRYFWWTVDDGTSDVFFTEKQDPSDTWLRIESCDVAGIKNISCLFTGFSAPKAWLTQANYLFQQLHAIPAYHEDFTLVTNVSYKLSTLDTVENLPAGYLFICPLEDIQCGIADQPVYYWSLDPSGVEPLTEEEAEQLGFPFFQLEMGATGKYWDGHIYEGLRQFYEGKGFDPYSQDVARELGLPLLQITWDPFEIEDTGSEYTNTSTESDEEESDENVGDEVENWDTTSVAGEDAEPPRFSRVDEAEMLPRSSSFVLVAWVQFTLIVINFFLLGVQFLA
ncbi:hypothetical protein B0H14DRAFT_3663676 [Mycena olivaceomarginata]|nr:hypothetical protein B0H14DRAFT_3663676 [Mycena olivaceomarginata]